MLTSSRRICIAECVAARVFAFVALLLAASAVSITHASPNPASLSSRSTNNINENNANLIENGAEGSSRAHTNAELIGAAYLPYTFGDADMVQYIDVIDADEAERPKRMESGAMPGVLRFGKRNQLALIDDLSGFEGASLLIKKEMPGVLRFGKRAVPGVLRFGKREPGSELPGVLRFGKRNVPGVLRFGRRR